MSQKMKPDYEKLGKELYEAIKYGFDYHTSDKEFLEDQDEDEKKQLIKFSNQFDEYFLDVKTQLMGRASENDIFWDTYTNIRVKEIYIK